MFGHLDQVPERSAGRILAMAEREQSRRIGCESKRQEPAANDGIRAQWIGLALPL